MAPLIEHRWNFLRIACQTSIDCGLDARRDTGGRTVGQLDTGEVAVQIFSHVQDGGTNLPAYFQEPEELARYKVYIPLYHALNATSIE